MFTDFTSTGTVRTVRDGGERAQDVHLDFHTAPELCAELSECRL